MKRLLMILSMILLVSCAALDNYYRYDSYAGIDGVDRGVNIYAAGGCAYYGVEENHVPMGRVVVAMPVHWTEIARVCEGVLDAEVGCAISNSSGAVRIYWVEGNVWAERHERCHVRHGVEHVAS